MTSAATGFLSRSRKCPSLLGLLQFLLQFESQKCPSLLSLLQFEKIARFGLEQSPAVYGCSTPLHSYRSGVEWSTHTATCRLDWSTNWSNRHFCNEVNR